MSDRPNAVIAGTYSARFEAFTQPVPHCGCWIWMGAHSTRIGYGSFRLNGKLERAHRAAYLIFRGDIPAGLCVLHKCDIPSCVNPDHLFLGTALDNARDREGKGRGNQPTGIRNARYTHPETTARGDRHPSRTTPGWCQGTKNGRAKLSLDDVFAIREDARPSRALAELYGVAKTTILGIRSRRLWRHL